MRKSLLGLVWLFVMTVWYWFYLPPLSVFSQSFWVFLVAGVWLGFVLFYLPKVAKTD